VDRLDQLFARSQREIEAHSSELAETETGRYFITEAAQLLAALRLWAQSQYRSDQVVRAMFETVDVVALQGVVTELRASGGVEARTAAGTVAGMLTLPTGQLMAIASCARRAL
jgi:hypothetical protein